MGLFSGTNRLFQGVRSLFGGQPPAPRPDPFAPPSTPIPGAPHIPDFVIGSAQPIFDGQGNEVSTKQPGLAHVLTFSSLWNTASKTYSWRWDEAYRRSRTDAIAMRRDCFLQGLLFERKYPTAQMAFNLEPEDKKNPKQMAVADYLKACVDVLPNVSAKLMMDLEALWYGRAGTQYIWDYQMVDKKPSFVPVDILPVNGDKIQTEWDGTPQVRLYGGAHIRNEKDLTPKNLSLLDPNLIPEDVAWTDRGMVLRLKRPYWRDRFCIHRADIIDADFYESDMAGGVGGVGIRHWIYWYNWVRNQVGSYILDALERAGVGGTNIFYYDPGNPQDKANAITAAKQMSRNTWIVWPRTPNDKGETKGVERIESSFAGAQILRDMMEYYDHYMERFVVGQTMSSGADNESGLGGSGRAQFAKATKQYILRHDALNLQATQTKYYVAPLIRNNKANCEAIYGGPLDFNVRWKFAIDVDDPADRLEAAKSLFDMGVKMKEDQLREIGGFEKPEEDDPTVGGQQAAEAAQGAGKPGGDGSSLFEGKPKDVFNGQPATNGHANGNGKPKDKEEEHHKPIRYAESDVKAVIKAVLDKESNRIDRYAWEERARKAGLDIEKMDRLAQAILHEHEPEQYQALPAKQPEEVPELTDHEKSVLKYSTMTDAELMREINGQY